MSSLAPKRIYKQGENFIVARLWCLGRFQRRPYSPTRQVEPKEGEKLAKENKAAWVETSAKNAINVGQYQFTLFRSFAFNSLLLPQTRFSSYV